MTDLFAEWVPSLPCQLKGHDAQLHGCVPSQPGAYIVYYGHPTGGQCLLADPVMNIEAVVCQGHAIYTRNRLNSSFMCPYCGVVLPFEMFARVVGPIVPTLKSEKHL